MTYNFDPERWFDNEMTALEKRHAAGELSDAEFEEAQSKLVDKYEEMLERVNIRYEYSSEN